MKRFLLTVSFLFSYIFIFSQTFGDFITTVNSLPEGDRQAEIDNFIDTASHFPYTEDTLAHFIYTGSVSSCASPGDLSGWDPAQAPMLNIAGTTFWYRTDTIENDSRLDYKIVINGSSWILDPRNPFTCPGGYGDNSELRMPEYEYPIEIDYISDIPHGTLFDTTFYSVLLGNSREIKVYTPPGYEQSSYDYPVVIVHDGSEYLSFAHMDNTLDFLIHEQLIDPVIAVFIPPVNRTEEYYTTDQEDFSTFVQEDIGTWLETKYRTKDEPGSHAVIGSSYGGNISLWFGMGASEEFGFVGAFSPFIEEDILAYFAVNPTMDLKIYINNGTYDHLDAIHESVNAFLPILDDQEYDYLFEEYPEGHSYGLWRAHIDDALIYFYPYTGAYTGISQNLKPKVEIQTRPNPFQAVTFISFESANNSHIRLEISDMNGKRVKCLNDSDMSSGKHEFIWDGTDFSGRELSQGVYFFSVYSDNRLLNTAEIIKL
jgi:enterochelin esterase-like enzyme